MRDKVSWRIVITTALTFAALNLASNDAEAAGSVINSFVWGVSPSGIYRDANYVYALLAGQLRRYTPGGSFVASYPLAGGFPRGGDICHLGPGYLCWVDAGTYMVYFATTTGSTLLSWSYSIGGPATDIAWTGGRADSIYLVKGLSGNTFYKYTSTGSAAGTWTTTSWLTSTGGFTVANAFENKSGCYLVGSPWASGQPSIAVSYPAGSLLQTWTNPPGNANGACYGDAFPSSYGGAYWVNWYTGTQLVALQVDLGNTSSFVSVHPASLGKLKALYR